MYFYQCQGTPLHPLHSIPQRCVPIALLSAFRTPRWSGTSLNCIRAVQNRNQAAGDWSRRAPYRNIQAIAPLFGSILASRHLETGDRSMTSNFKDDA